MKITERLRNSRVAAGWQLFKVVYDASDNALLETYRHTLRDEYYTVREWLDNRTSREIWDEAAQAWKTVDYQTYCNYAAVQHNYDIPFPAVQGC